MNVLVCGRIKQGKTTFALYLAKQWALGIVMWDPRHMIDIEGATYVSDSEELEDAIQDKAWREGPIIFRPNGLDVSGDFESLSDVLFNPPQRFENFSLIIDEAAEMQSPHSIAPHLSRAIRQHPRSVLIIQTTHSLQDWHRASKDLMNDLYCFRLIGRSLQAVIDFCDGSEELERTIRTLPNHHLVHISFEAADDYEEFEVIDDPAEWFVPTTAEHRGVMVNQDTVEEEI